MNNKTISQLRQIIIFGSSFLCVLLSAHRFFLAATRAQSILNNIIFGALLFGLAFGVFRQYRWVLRGTSFVLLMLAIILPVGVFNPFTAGDYLAVGKETPSVPQTLMWLIPVEFLLLAIIFIIDPKKEFRR